MIDQCKLIETQKMFAIIMSNFCDGKKQMEFFQYKSKKHTLVFK